MGNSASFSDTFDYHTAVQAATEGCTPVYRAASHPTELVSRYVDQEVNNVWDLFNATVERGPNRKFLGRRFRDNDGQLGDFEWMTYGEARKIALAFGSVISSSPGWCPYIQFPDEMYAPARNLRILGIYAKNCVEWFLAEQACNAYDIALCPLYDTLGDEAMEFILKQTKMTICLVAFESLEAMLRVIKDDDTGVIKDGIHLQHIICVDPPHPSKPDKVLAQFQSAILQLKSLGVDIKAWHDVVSKCSQPLPVSPGPREHLNTLCYTSGTTGMPKAVLLTQGMVVSVVIGACRGPISSSGMFEVGPNDKALSYLPLAHVLERCVCLIILAKGGAFGVYSGDMAKLLDDVRTLQPTVFVSVPRLFNRITDKVGMSLTEKKPPVQLLFNMGLNSKINRRRAASVTTHKVWDNIVFGKIKNMMGGQVRGMISGGAPLDPVVCEKMVAFFGCPLMQGYGLSETFGPCALMHPGDPEVGYIGGIWPSVEWKLQSVPELNYYVTSKIPAGELCLRGPGVSPGYFQNPEATKASWDDEGFFHTGDIATINPKTKCLKIIDRKKNIFKLSQGEYIAPEKIEAVYSQALSVGQIFVFGYSGSSYLVAIVHPDVEGSAKWIASNCPGTSDLNILCKNKKYKEYVMQDMEQVASKLGLKGFEKVRQVYLTPEAFTVENGLLTPTSKVRRLECKQYFQKQLDEMYNQ